MTLRIVIGAAGLIGSAITKQLADADGHLVAVDPNLDDLPSKVEILRTNATDETFTEWLATAIKGCERAELYYAGGAVAPLRRIADTSPSDFDDALNDLTAAYTVVSRFAEIAYQAQVPASIVMIGSVGASRAHRYLVGYDAARAGLESVARGMALEYGLHEITTRVLAVGPVAESNSTRADGESLPALTRLVPTQRYTPVDQVAAAAIAYGAPAFDAANGHTLSIDGGLSIQLRPADVERRPGQ